ncbi:phytanoyl-CoA dioxygenase family protein [Nakamurella aerolata]|uniref:Phytanoyl-CoA dioxygenase n=1 Tax=Nakamurella aerolata TaxID=1656892 RepID=A0A849A8M7_9ACTN|nr:phytanoyl-CoA dioxygenase family protein [Nakamurella aerolata]NNG35431.1 phytanoyl-CoA dioxygenase [Nakamurella aerolata]
MSTQTLAAADAAVTSTDQALADLGVTADTLPPQAYRQLDEQGFLALPGVIDPAWLDELRARTDELLAFEGGSAGHEVGGQTGVDMLADLLNKGEVFERMLRTPQVLAAVQHVLGDFRVNSLNYRAAPPGSGNQGLHSDCGNPTDDGRYRICNSIWLLDDFTDHNGSTRYVAGTHTAGKLPADVMDDVLAPHPDQQLLTGTAGTVVIFNAHLWHGGTQNATDTARRGMTLSFTQRDLPQQLDQAAHIRKRVYDRLSPAERYLLDV